MKKSAQVTDYRLHAESSICNQKGSALLITLLIVSILTALTVDFAYDVYIGTSALSNWSNAQKASLLAKSGQSLASSSMKEIKGLSYTHIGELILPVEKSFGPDAALTIKLEDENAKFNVNSIIYSDGKRTNDKALASLQKLFGYLNINPDIALSIADWIDTDNFPKTSGSEENAKNAGLWSIEELKFIKGIDKKTFDTISPFLTVYGNKAININTAKLPVLISLHPDMTEALVKKIIDYRESAPFEDITHIVRVSGMETIGQKIQCSIEWCPMITVKSSSFRVTATATVDEITRVIESVVDTSMNINFWREV